MAAPRYGMFGRVKTPEEHEWLHGRMASSSAPALAAAFCERFGWDPSEFTAYHAHAYALNRPASCAADDGTPRPQWPDPGSEYSRLTAILRGGATVAEAQALFWEEFGWVPSARLVRAHARGVGLDRPPMRRRRAWSGREIARAVGR